MKLRHFFLRALFAAIFAGVCLTPTATVHAQSPYPSRPIQLFHGFAVGANPDIISRLLGPALGERLGVSIVVDSKPGASGRIATNHVSKLTPDGYAMLMLTGGDSVMAATAGDLPYDLLRDFAFVSGATKFPFLILVLADSPYKTLSDLIDDAKKRPGRLTYGSSGIASTLHLAGELLKEMAGIDMLHVPFKGNQAQEHAAGRIDVSVSVSASAMPHIRSGKLRVLAVTGPERSRDFPDAPTVRETLPGYEVLSWLGLAVPAATPQAIVDRLSTEVRAALERDDVKTRLLGLGAEPYGTTGAEFRTRVETDVRKWRALAAKVKLD